MLCNFTSPREAQAVKTPHLMLYPGSANQGPLRKISRIKPRNSINAILPIVAEVIIAQVISNVSISQRFHTQKSPGESDHSHTCSDKRRAAPVFSDIALAKTAGAETWNNLGTLP